MPKTTKRKTSQKFVEAIGRRKTAIARVRVFISKAKKRSVKETDATKKVAASEAIMVNDAPLSTYFTLEKFQHIVEEPFKKMKTGQEFQVTVKVLGGGSHGQAQAIRLGIARALKIHNPEFLPELRSAGLLTRDPRMKERKKPGLKGARRGQQWSKR